MTIFNSGAPPSSGGGGWKLYSHDELVNGTMTFQVGDLIHIVYNSTTSMDRAEAYFTVNSVSYVPNAQDYITLGVDGIFIYINGLASMSSISITNQVIVFKGSNLNVYVRLSPWWGYKFDQMTAISNQISACEMSSKADIKVFRYE